MARNEANVKQESAEGVIDGELTEQELESIVGGCGHHRHHRHHHREHRRTGWDDLPVNRSWDDLPINRTID